MSAVDMENVGSNKHATLGGLTLMKFNSFVWDLYRQSERGAKAVERFSHLDDEFVAPESRKFRIRLPDDVKDLFPLEDQEFDIDMSELFDRTFSDQKFANIDAANDLVESVLLESGIPMIFTNNAGEDVEFWIMGEGNIGWLHLIPAVSLGLYRAHPDFFMPYNFLCKFNRLEEIHAEFDIPLPRVPGKLDVNGRLKYYVTINRVWHEWRNLHGWSPAEMCAFLYDFAPQWVSSRDSHDLPSPSKVWLVTADPVDFDWLDNATEDSTNEWAGNLAIRRGDILMMYCRSPRRHIHSIWRALSDGFVDPFFHYHGTVEICRKIPTVSVFFSDLSQHPLLFEKSAVRAHFQGPSSKAAFTVEEYEAVLEIMKDNGLDLSRLPRIPLSDWQPPAELMNERDVEVHLIEPFLERLGYREGDWIRQMPVKMGRGERNYPDYAIGAKTNRGEESARMVLESKYQLSAQREFMDAFYQVKSYALRLQCGVMAMAAREGVWVFPPVKGSFDFRNVIGKTWAELANPDSFHDVLSHIGKDVVLDKMRRVTSK